MKKIFSVFFILLAFIFTIGTLSGSNIKQKVFADNVSEDKTNLNIQSKSAILLDANSGTVILKVNEKQRLPIASMCKIMTLLLTFEAIENGEISMDEEIRISENASSMGGSQIFLESNADYKVSELVKGITVASANDACVAIAERLCGSEEEFVNKMNKKANELNMENTNFTNCTGLPKAGQYSCSEDVSIMFSNLIKHKDYFNFSSIWMDEISHPKGRKTSISNTNKLIRFYEGCDSGKTGYTSEAGHCLAASAVRNGMRLISVVISCPDSKTRFKDVSSMFNYGFANYTNKVIVDDKTPLDLDVKIVGGKKDTLKVYAENPIYLFSSKQEKRSVEINFTPLEKIKAPVKQGDKIGLLKVFENGVEISHVNVIAGENIYEKTYFDEIYDITKNWAII